MASLITDASEPPEFLLLLACFTYMCFSLLPTKSIHHTLIFSIFQELFPDQVYK